MPFYRESVGDTERKRRISAAVLVPALQPSLVESSQAPEISVYASWQDGIAVLQKSAKDARYEIDTVYGPTSEGGEFWLHTRAGDEAEMSPREHGQDSRYIDQQDIVRACYFHTHPEFLLTEKEGYGIGPSLQDIVTATIEEEGVHSSLEEMNSDQQIKITHAIGDTFGIWYFTGEQSFVHLEHSVRETAKIFAEEVELWLRGLSVEGRLGEFLRERSSMMNKYHDFIAPDGISDEELIQFLMLKVEQTGIKKESLSIEIRGLYGYVLVNYPTERMKQAHQEMTRVQDYYNDFFSTQGTLAKVTAEVLGETEEGRVAKIMEEFPKLQEMYASVGADARFVSWDNVANEPACAGVDFTPEQIK